MTSLLQRVMGGTGGGKGDVGESLSAPGAPWHDPERCSVQIALVAG